METDTDFDSYLNGAISDLHLLQLMRKPSETVSHSFFDINKVPNRELSDEFVSAEKPFPAL